MQKNVPDDPAIDVPSARRPLTLDMAQLDRLIHDYLEVAIVDDRLRGLFYSELQQIINRFVAAGFRWSPALREAAIGRGESPLPLHSRVFGLPPDQLRGLLEHTESAVFPRELPIDDHHLWEFPIHAHVLHHRERSCYTESRDDDALLAVDVLSYGRERGRVMTGGPLAMARRHDRDFLRWMIEKTVSRANHAYSAAGAEQARDHLLRFMAPYSDFYHECAERIGAPGLVFRLDGVSDVIIEGPIERFPGPWLQELDLQPGRFDVIVLFNRGVPGAARFPQVDHTAGVHSRVPGVLCISASALGYDRGELVNAAHDRCESGDVLVHELGHCFQLYHIGENDFDRPYMGVARDTLWRPARQRFASVWPESRRFVANLHARTMFMNYMDAETESNVHLFFTRGQATRARVMAKLHYRDWLRRGDPWPAAPRYLAPHGVGQESPARACFGAPVEIAIPLQQEWCPGFTRRRP